MSARMPLSAYVLLTIVGVATLVISASLVIYADKARLGYSYAVHSVIFFPFSRGIAVGTGIGAVISACLVYVGHRILKRRHMRGARVVPVWFALVLMIALALYVKEVLQINFSWTPTEESTKVSSLS